MGANVGNVALDYVQPAFRDRVLRAELTALLDLDAAPYVQPDWRYLECGDSDVAGCIIGRSNGQRVSEALSQVSR